MHDPREQQSDDSTRRESPATRGHGPEGPGASSGLESREQRRTVPGTASADEGYRPGEGTAGGDQLAGVEADPDDTAPARARADGDDEAGRSAPRT